MELQLPQATRNFYVDGHKPTPHWRSLMLQCHSSVGSQTFLHWTYIFLLLFDLCGLFPNYWLKKQFDMNEVLVNLVHFLLYSYIYW